MHRTLITAFLAWRRDQDCEEQQPAGMAGVIPGPHSVPSFYPGTTWLYERGHTISTDLSRLDEPRDVEVLLPDSMIDIEHNRQGKASSPDQQRKTLKNCHHRHHGKTRRPGKRPPQGKSHLD